MKQPIIRFSLIVCCLAVMAGCSNIVNHFAFYPDTQHIIRKSTVCRLGLADGNTPYIVPMCFGYEDNAVYLHGALEGRKIDIIEKNPNVCVEFESRADVIKNKTPCAWGMQYQSVIGFGTADLLQGLDEKQYALNVIMKQYSDLAYDFEDSALAVTAVIRVVIDLMTGKQSGF